METRIIKNPDSTNCPECGREIVFPFDPELIIHEHYAITQMGVEIAIPSPVDGRSWITYCECGALLAYEFHLVAIRILADRED